MKTLNCKRLLKSISISVLLVSSLVLIPSLAIAEEESFKKIDDIIISNGDKQLWNLKNVDITTFIHSVAEKTGKNFAIDPRVTGKITFISAQPINGDELYQAFLSVLQVNGFVALPDGAVIKIVPDHVAKGASSPLYKETPNKNSDSMAVAVASLKYVPATELATVLSQFLTPHGHVAAYSPSNDLILADTAGNISHLLQLIEQIDQQRASSIEVINLQNAEAKFLADTLTNMLQKNTAAKAVAGAAELKLAADERTNSILLSGGSNEQRNQIRSVISQLDIAQSSHANDTEVIYLKHLQAERAATIVNGIIQNYLQQASEATTTANESNKEQSSSNSNNKKQELFNNNRGQNRQLNTSYSTTSGYFTSATPDNDIASIVATFPQSGSVSPAVQWEESTNSLVVTAPKDLINKIRQVLAKLDIRRPQVLIEAVIAEVSTNRQRELGIEWDVNSGNFNFQTGFLPQLPLSFIGSNGQLSTLSTSGVGQGLSAFFNNNSLRVLIRALESDQKSNILATPNLVTLDNEPAQIKVGSKISFATAQIQNDPTGGNPFSFFVREDVGLVLTINPQISPDGAIKLLIQQQLSAIIPGTQNAGGNPDTSERFIRTTIMADHGKILVLGGLLQNQWSDNVSKVPFLSKIPLLGELFKDRTKTGAKTNLMIFLKPTVLYDADASATVSNGKYEFLRQSQLSTESNNPFQNNYESPVLPTEGKELVLPPPFKTGSALPPLQGK